MESVTDSSWVPSQLLTTELHAHLYGCISAEDLWEWGRDLWRNQEQRLRWYASEYEKLCGVVPQWETYWKTSQGFTELKRDFEMLKPGPFARFQAGFNLAIALFPLNPQNTDFFSKILKAEFTKGTRYGEYRIVIPPHFSKDQINQYVLSILTTLGDVKAETGWLAHIVLSLSRDPELFRSQHQTLRRTLEGFSQSTAELGLVGIDLCGVEEGHPPREIAEVLREVILENQKSSHQRLAILYHVGESFADKSLPSTIRWVHEATTLGAHRLGHGIALGIDPSVHMDPFNTAQLRLTESVQERLDHLDWLDRYGQSLKEAGYPVDSPALIKERKSLLETSSHRLKDTIVIPEAALSFKERVETIRCLQMAVLTMVARSGAAIEVCPTSNLRIGQIPSWEQHSLAGFCRYNDQNPHQPVPLVIGADDPGIFNQSLPQEWDLIQKEFSQLRPWMSSFSAWSQQFRSATIVGP